MYRRSQSKCHSREGNHVAPDSRSELKNRSIAQSELCNLIAGNGSPNISFKRSTFHIKFVKGKCSINFTLRQHG